MNQGCDASIFLDDSNGNQSHLIERQANPSQTLKGFDEIEMIKEELEKSCPGVVSCADTLALATRDAVLLVLTSNLSYYFVFCSNLSTQDFECLLVFCRNHG